MQRNSLATAQLIMVIFEHMGHPTLNPKNRNNPKVAKVLTRINLGAQFQFPCRRFPIPVMLVQEIPKASIGPPKKAHRGSGPYGRAALDSSAQQPRINRHLTELEQDNYHAIQIDIPKSESLFPSPQKLIIAPRKQHKITPNVRKLLTTRKTLTNLLDEAGFAADVYRDAAVKPGVYPSRTFCSVCGYWGKYGCMKCGDRYCGEACAETHRGINPREYELILETRCMKFF